MFPDRGIIPAPIFQFASCRRAQVSKPRLQRAFIGAGAILIAASVSAQGITGTKQGKGGSVVQGSAGTNGSSGDNGLEHCDKPMGALAVVEPQDYVLTALSALRPVSRRSA